jgi:hypothetical protein
METGRVWGGAAGLGFSGPGSRVVAYHATLFVMGHNNLRRPPQSVTVGPDAKCP